MAFIVNLLLSHRRYFDKTFIEMFLEWSSTGRRFCCLVLILIVTMATKMQKKKEEYL